MRDHCPLLGGHHIRDFKCSRTSDHPETGHLKLKMSFAQYASITCHYASYKIYDDVYAVPTYTETVRGLRVKKSEVCLVERRSITTKDGSQEMVVCQCREMQRVRDTLVTAHHYHAKEIPTERCFHAMLVTHPGVVWNTPMMVLDDVVRINETMYMVDAEQRVLIRYTPNAKKTFQCLVCRHGACPHIHRLETVGIDHSDLLESTDGSTPHESKRPRGVPRDVIDTPQQKIAIAPQMDQKKRCPNRSGTVARIYDTDGWSEYTYATDETLNSLRERSCDRIFRYSREVWFTHRLVYLYIDNMAKGNACFDAFHTMMELQYARYGQQFCSKPTTRTVLQAALYHLDLDVDKALRCDQCSALPLRHRVFVLDGTSNGYLNKTKTTRYNDPSSSGRKERPGSDFALVKTNEQRAMVLKPFEATDTRADFVTRYIKNIWSVDVPGLVHFTRHALIHCPVEHVAVFMKDIASPYPITSTVRYEMVLPNGGLLARCMHGSMTAADREELRCVWPSLWMLCRSFDRIPVPWVPLMESIRDLAVSIYTTQDTEYLRWDTTNEEHPFVCFPEFPRRRVSPWPRKASTYEESCTKKILKHRHFSPGVFLICCPHGTILGFCAMQDHESVHTAFEFIVERFETPPGMIVYDNGCNLYRYGMMRCPGIFSQIRILIDKFHAPGHVLCPPSFTFQYYPDDTEAMLGRTTYGDLNTQVVEQTNARLRKFEKSLGFMTQENYISFVRVIASLLNFFS